MDIDERRDGDRASTLAATGVEAEPQDSRAEKNERHVVRPVELVRVSQVEHGRQG